MARRATGDGDDYSDAEAEALANALAYAFDDLDNESGGEYSGPVRMEVTAQVEWAGTVEHSNGGVRRVRLDTLSPGQVKALRESVGKTRGAGRSYDDVGWHAKLRRLTQTQHGSSSLGDAFGGNQPSQKTLLRWLSEDQTPNSANRARIDEAYNRAQSTVVHRRTGKAADILTGQLHGKYGVNVRFRDIQGIDFGR